MKFISILLSHLRKYGIKDVEIQTDNGSEFISSVYSKRDSAFPKLIEQVYKGKDNLIPLRTPEWNGYVEIKNIHFFNLPPIILS